MVCHSASRVYRTLIFMYNVRPTGTTRTGGSFSSEIIQEVWEKGIEIPGKNAQFWRRDTCGATIYRDDYGLTNSIFGWEVDHICPVSKGGTDNLVNLQPLQWENNRHKGDNSPNWVCKIKS